MSTFIRLIGVALLLVHYQLCFAEYPCSPIEQKGKKITKKDIYICGDRTTSKQCEAKAKNGKKRCQWNKQCCVGKSKKCARIIEADACYATPECYFDCDGDLFGNIGKLYMSVTKVDIDRSKTTNSKAKCVVPDSDWVFDGTPYEYVEGLSIIKTDELGYTYKAKVNPRAFFSEEEIKKIQQSMPVSMSPPKKGQMPSLVAISKQINNLRKKTKPKKKGRIASLMSKFSRKKSKKPKGKSNKQIVRRRRLFSAGDWENLASTEKALGMLEFYTKKDKKWWNGVGTLVKHTKKGKKHYDWVLTCGHNCYEPRKNSGKVRRMMMAAGYNNVAHDRHDPFATARGATEVTHGKWGGSSMHKKNGNGAAFYVAEYKKKGQQETKYDWCVVRFKMPDDTNYNYKKFSYNSGDAVDSKKDINFLTYYKGGNPWTDWRFRQVGLIKTRADQKKTEKNPNREFKVKDSIFASEAGHFTASGNSGSPYFEWGKLDTIIGIHSGYPGGKTSGMRITKERYKAICKVIPGSGCSGLKKADTSGSSAYFDGYGDELLQSEYEFMDEEDEYYADDMEYGKEDDYFGDIVVYNNEKVIAATSANNNGLGVVFVLIGLLISCFSCFVFGICGGALFGFVLNGAHDKIVE